MIFSPCDYTSIGTCPLPNGDCDKCAKRKFTPQEAERIGKQFDRQMGWSDDEEEEDDSEE